MRPPVLGLRRDVVYMYRVPVAGELRELVNVEFRDRPGTGFEPLSDLEVAEIPAHFQAVGLGATQLACRPPSTTSSVAVMYFAASEARNATASATSQASPMCPIGTCA